MSLGKQVRAEVEVFSELATLCSSPGYVHSIAFLCFRDNAIRYADVVTQKDILDQFSMQCLVRTEIATLIGLTCKGEIDYSLPTPETIQEQISRSDALLKELHQSLLPPIEVLFDPSKIGCPDFSPFTLGTVLREAIFYGGESAYHFQYLDFAKARYNKDGPWLVQNRGFSIDQAFDVVEAIQKFQNERLNSILTELRSKPLSEWSVLDAYTFTIDDIAKILQHEYDVVRRVIESFVAVTPIDGFEALDDFNPINAFPIIRLFDGRYLLFQNYGLVQALYESPFFWIHADKAYRSIGSEHRGQFTEEFSAERLKLVFGEARVYKNIDIVDSKGNRAGEIDVLVVFSDRAIVLQAKSKRLTIEARKGNGLTLQDDFKKAVQDSYDQAFLCSSLLTDSKYKLCDEAGAELKISRAYKEVYPVCVVSDHYPALSFQARQFLYFNQTERIKPPFVMDIFLLDVLSEMLQSPLYFLSYLNRRALYGEKILAAHELTVLSYHLKQNLWMDGDYSMMHLGDDVCADLDLAMLVRRDGVPGKATPDGILTNFADSHFARLIREIETVAHPTTIELGFTLLALSGDTISMLNDGIKRLINLVRRDKNHHDITLGFDEGKSGITIHCSFDQDSIASARLETHCKRRKYAQKADSWLGVCINPDSDAPRVIRFGMHAVFEWVQSDDMDRLTGGMPEASDIKGKTRLDFKSMRAKIKVGRNDKCPCGSGKKYKKCCI